MIDELQDVLPNIGSFLPLRQCIQLRILNSVWKNAMTRACLQHQIRFVAEYKSDVSYYHEYRRWKRESLYQYNQWYVAHDYTTLDKNSEYYFSLSQNKLVGDFQECEDNFELGYVKELKISMPGFTFEDDYFPSELLEEGDTEGELEVTGDAVAPYDPILFDFMHSLETTKLQVKSRIQHVGEYDNDYEIQFLMIDNIVITANVYFLYTAQRYTSSNE
jgi:hypothetical protein